MRRLLPLVGVLLAVLPGAQAARASTPGLLAVGYTIDAIPPTRSDTAYPVCGVETVPFINTVYEYDPIGACPTDGFMVHYTGTITLPAHETIRFWVAADDGGTLKIGQHEIGTWDDKGCSAYESADLTLDAGIALPVDAWFYENGGGTCFMAAWSIDGAEWTIIPPEAFSSPTTSTTTTSSTSTTNSTTTSTTSTTSTSTSVAPRQTLPEPTSQATTTTQTIQTTTTTSVPVTAQPSTSLTSAPSTSSTTIPTTSIEAPSINASTSSSEPLPSEPSTTTTVPEERYTPAEALAAAVDAGTVAELTGDEAEAVFAAIDEATLTPEIGALLVAAVQDAPLEVREAFEAKINVYGGATDNYIPVGSTVPVSTRRVIIITTGLLVAMPTPRRSRP
jgi:hypothetical protein